jgi:hypothetical protein
MVESARMSEGWNRDSHRRVAQAPDDLRALHLMCREGRLYDVERWTAEGKPLQLAPEAVPKRRRPKTALQIALESGQHSLALLLLKSGYRLDLETYAPLDLALESRRWDLFDLLLEWGADLKSTDVYAVLETYNVDLYERCWVAGYDLTQRHEMGSVLGHGTSNRPLLGFAKRYRLENPRIQQELNIALGYHVRAGNEKGISLCLWAGGDPHAPTPNPEFGIAEEADPEDEEEGPLDWSAIEEATNAGRLDILRRLGPDPERDDFDNLYRYARHESVVAFLLTLRLPRNLTSILSCHVSWLGNRFPGLARSGSGAIEALLSSGVRWTEIDAKQLAEIRRSLLQAGDYELKRILSRLKKPEICAPEVYQEITRTPRMQERMIAIGLAKKLINDRGRSGKRSRDAHPRRSRAR